MIELAQLLIVAGGLVLAAVMTAIVVDAIADQRAPAAQRLKSGRASRRHRRAS